MYGWSPYVPVAQRRADAARQMAKRRKDGVPVSPVVITGRTIATSFWGRSWCDAMESYGDYANRLPRGRSYVRNGSVVDLQVQPGLVSAAVSGSQLYRTTVRVQPLAPERWRAVVHQHAGQVSSLVDLLQGKLPTSLLHALSDRSSGLFPGPSELVFTCSCPDWASMCKHVAAVLYGVGARLDTDPGLFFVLRGVDVADLSARGAAVQFTSPAGEDDLGGADLADLFGIDLGGAPVVVKAPVVAKAAVVAPVKVVAKAPVVAPVKIAAKVAAKPKPVTKVKAAVAPKAASRVVPTVASTMSGAELRRLGVHSRAVALWVSVGVLQRTGERGVYATTAQTEACLKPYRDALSEVRLTASGPAR